MIKGLGNNIIGIFIGTAENECKFIRICLFPLAFAILVSNRFFDARINLIEKVHFSISVEISE